MDKDILKNAENEAGWLGIFRTIACVGDSLSSGELVSVDKNGAYEYNDYFEYSWGQYIARKYGNTVYNFSRGGMTAKEYLNQARHLDALINCRLREIDYWRDLSSSVSGSNFEPHYNPNKPTEAPFVRCLEKIDAIQRDVAKKVAYLVCLKETINAAIDRLASREEQLVLRYRYLDNCSWEEISRMLNVSLRTVHRIHGSALQNFSVPN